MPETQRTPPRLLLTASSTLGDRISTIAWAPRGGSLLASSVAGDSLILSKDVRPVSSLAAQPGGALCGAWSYDGALVAVGGANCEVQISSRLGEFLWASALRGWPEAVAWAPDRNHVAVASGVDISVLDQDGTLVVEYPWLPGGINALAWDWSSGRLAAGTRGGVNWYHPPDPDLTAGTASVGAVLALAPSPDGRWLAGGKLNGCLVIWTIATGRAIALSGYQGGVRHLSWRADGKQLAVGAHGETSVWTLDDGQPRGEPLTLSEFEPVVGGLAFHPYLNLLAIGRASGDLSLWSSDSDDVSASTTDVGEEITALSWRPAGESLAVGTAQGRVLIYRLA